VTSHQSPSHTPILAPKIKPCNSLSKTATGDRPVGIEFGAYKKLTEKLILIVNRCLQFALAKCKTRLDIREDLLERTRAASTKAFEAISVANLLQMPSGGQNEK
jgi:hypothetical protein